MHRWVGQDNLFFSFPGGNSFFWTTIFFNHFGFLSIFSHGFFNLFSPKNGGLSGLADLPLEAREESRGVDVLTF